MAKIFNCLFSIDIRIRVIGFKITIMLRLAVTVLGCNLLSQSPNNETNGEEIATVVDIDSAVSASPDQALAALDQAVVESRPEPLPTSLIGPADLLYLGAFRLPNALPFEIGWAWSGGALAFRPDGDPKTYEGVSDSTCTADRACRTVKCREETVARCVDFSAPKVVQFLPDEAVMALEEVAPLPVSQFHRSLRGPDNIRKQHRGEHPV